MTTRIKLRRDTAANWLSANPILAAGEPGLETDTGKIKYGDGVTAYSLLPHAGGDQLANDAAVTVQVGDDTKWLVQMARDRQWTGNSYNGISANSSVYDRDGNIVVAGIIRQAEDNFFIAKYTPAGVCLWKKAYLEVDTNVTVYLESGIAIDSNNNIIVSLGYDAPVYGITKLDPDGNTIWETVYESVDDSTVVSGVSVDSHDNIVISTWEPSPGGQIGIVKINKTTGSTIWSKLLSNNNVKWAMAVGCAVDYQNNIVITGYQQDYNDNTTEEIVVAKLDTDGNLLWQKKAVMPDSAVDKKYVNPANVQTDTLGNIYITGSYVVQNPTSDGPFKTSSAVYVAKLNMSGVVQWARRAGPGPCWWTGISTTVGADGDLYLAAATVTRAWGEGALGDDTNYEKGDYEHNLVIARYVGATGDVVWQKYFNNKHQQVYSESNNTEFLSAWRSIDIMDDKLVICGSVQTAHDYGGNRSSNSYYTAWIAQLSTDGSIDYDLGGFSFVDSRVPGKPINMTTVFNTALSLSAGSTAPVDGTDSNQMIEAPISTKTIRSKPHTWTFDSEGTIKAPAEGNIVLDQTELGYVNFLGYEYNDESDIWLQSVVGDADGYTYAVGADYWNTRRTTIYKFDPTGKRVWTVQLRTGSGANFTISKTGGVYTIDNMNYGGNNYRVGDTVRILGYDLGGDSPQNDLFISVLTVNEDFGTILTYAIQRGVASAGDGTYYSQEDYYDNGKSRPNSITIDPTTGNLVVAGEQYVYDGARTGILTLTIDSESGAVLDSTDLHYVGNSLYPHDVQVSDTGVTAVVGQSYGEVQDIATIDPQSASGLGYMIVSKEAIVIANNNVDLYPGHNDNGNDWYVSGTGILERAYINNYNKYHNVPVTVAQGQGTPQFTIQGSSGSYVQATTVNNGGTGGYLVGHRLKVLGSLLGGADGTNDATLEVTQVTNEGNIMQANVISGTSAADAVYVNVTGTNTQVGTGATVDLYFSPENGSMYSYNIATNGDFYTYGDVLTIPGTTFPGSTSPANDIVLYVSWTSGGFAGTRGSIIGLGNSVSASISPDYLSMEIQGYPSMDFTGPGTWTLSQALNGQAFIWTPSFQKTFGSTDNDWFTAVAWQGTSVYAGGTTYYNDQDNPFIVKMASDGTVTWKKNLQHADYSNAELMQIGTDADGVVAIGHCYDEDIGQWVTFMFKLDNAGDLLWHKQIRTIDSSPNQSTLAIDPATGDILTAIGGYNNDVDWNIIYLQKFDKDGNIIWKRKLFSSGGEGFNEDNGYRALHIAGDSFFFAGWSYWMMDYSENGFCARLPLDGTGTGEWGIWSYHENDDNNVRTYDKGGTTYVVLSTVEDQVGHGIEIDNSRFYYTDWPNITFPVINQVIREEKGGAIVFPDGTRQTTSAAISQQVKVGREYTITPNDSGAHIYIDETHNDGNTWIYIPYWEFVKLPVGFKFTIVNRSNYNCWIQIQSGPNQRGRIYGNSGRQQYSYHSWYVNGNSDFANCVDLIKVREGWNDNGFGNRGDEWVIRGESNGYDNYYWSDN